MGPAEVARHIEGITAHEISLAKNRHITLAKLNKAITDVVNAFARVAVRLLRLLYGCQRRSPRGAAATRPPSMTRS
ncbi:Tn3 family transposase [Microtetraspora malaysiensis]|uniref:Tn3 family transposase n=1 Tax=Microtetraspora malaysiensis TaxID=161358 RepID=UPI003D8D28AF